MCLCKTIALTLSYFVKSKTTVWEHIMTWHLYLYDILRRWVSIRNNHWSSFSAFLQWKLNIKCVPDVQKRDCSTCHLLLALAAPRKKEYKQIFRNGITEQIRLSKGFLKKQIHYISYIPTKRFLHRIIIVGYYVPITYWFYWCK